METEEMGFKRWVVLESMGHRRLAGLVTEETIGGHSFIRIDIPATEKEPAATQYYGAGSVYCMTPVTEEIARAFAKNARPAPVAVWEIQPERQVEWRTHPAKAFDGDGINGNYQEGAAEDSF